MLGAGLTRKDFQVGVSLLDKGQTLKAVYAHHISPTSAAAAEVVRGLKEEAPTAIALGCCLQTCLLARLHMQDGPATPSSRAMMGLPSCLHCRAAVSNRVQLLCTC